jgi:hypothetical protein
MSSSESKIRSSAPASTTAETTGRLLGFIGRALHA